ncbi:hypothetical protein HDK90DRAFT_136694 [Phyllosticta capitalensis]|uniref:Secreted protein n=1 Tax=Phyllosticta capitalensis TaxID=121624 RepID=A0ABR1YYU2_9PEZI
MTVLLPARCAVLWSSIMPNTGTSPLAQGTCRALATAKTTQAIAHSRFLPFAAKRSDFASTPPTSTVVAPSETRLKDVSSFPLLVERTFIPHRLRQSARGCTANCKSQRQRRPSAVKFAPTALALFFFSSRARPRPRPSATSSGGECTRSLPCNCVATVPMLIRFFSRADETGPSKGESLSKSGCRRRNTTPAAML